MKSQHARRLAFERLEAKASPSALLLAIAPLDEPDQQVVEAEMREAERAMFATPAETIAASAEMTARSATDGPLLTFIDQHTRRAARRDSVPVPTAEEAAVADRMMRAADQDLRNLMIAEMLSGQPGAVEGVFTQIQY